MKENTAQYYRHFKGGKYRLLHIAKDSEDPSRELVVYQALYGDHDVWVRPKAMFFSEVERDGYRGPRFAPISEAEALGKSKLIAKRAYIAVAAILVMIVPEMIMDGEDGNLLVRVVMMSLLSALFFVIYKLVTFLRNRF